MKLDSSCEYTLKKKLYIYAYNNNFCFKYLKELFSINISDELINLNT